MIRQFKDLFYSVFPTNDYLRYSSGETNIILSAPHGGGSRPYSIPNRSYGVLGRDTYTRTLTEKLLELSVLKPYYVISDLHRSKLDLNRDLYEGAQGNYKAEVVWRMWNRVLYSYTQHAVDKFGKVLYVDIHSHDDNDTFELGYNLSAVDYLSLYDGKKIYNESTLDSLGYSTSSMLFGRGSFKNSLEIMGYKTFMPYGDELYFNGGRNVEVYNGNGIGAIQIEVPYSKLYEDIDRVARAITFAIDSFCYKFIR